LNEGKRPIRRSGLSSKLLPDNFLVIVDDSTESAVTLNQTAAAVWEFCDGEHTADDIVNELIRLLGTSAGAELSSGVAAVIEELTNSGLLDFV
jgi:hypothetical protein